MKVLAVLVFGALTIGATACSRNSDERASPKDVVDPVGTNIGLRGNVSLVQLDTSTFADAERGMTFSFSCTSPDGSNCGSNFDKRGYSLLVRPESDVQVLATSRYCNTNWLVANATATTQSFAVSALLKRIDVNAMKITRTDGSQYFANGEYDLTMSNGTKTCTVATNNPTKTGIEVPKGFIYVVTVHASSEENVPQTQVFTLDFTNTGHGG